MVRTRASRTAPAESAPQSRRPTLARRSKPTNQALVESSAEEDDTDRSDVSIDSESDSEDGADARMDRSMNDLDIYATRGRAAGKKRGRTSRSAHKGTSQGTPTKASRRGGPSKRTPTKQSPKGRKRGHPPTNSPPSKKTKTEPEPQSSGIIPNWLDPKVPYSAWVDIFSYAAMANGTIGNTWLVHASSTCKAFLEPALAVLYRCPIPSSSAKAKKLASHLLTSSGQMMINYRIKVESLYIDTDYFSAVMMAAIAASLPRLREIIPFTRFDQPPYRELDRVIRWGHSPSVFNYMTEPPDDRIGCPDHQPVVLRSWEWSGRLLTGAGMTVDNLCQVHDSVTFAQLSRVSFTNFQVPSLKMKTIPTAEEQEIFAEDYRIIDTIAYSITKLTHLKHLVFESSTVVGGRMLSRLPNGLVHLELINCWEVNSDDFAGVLKTHGRSLRFLTLNHNQSLDLAFLTELATHCPNLEELRIDMSFYRLHDTVNDSDPMYEQALLPGQMPLWPSSLRLIEVEHVRQWSVEAAETFFQSLIDSAPNLPYLRHLSIKTSLQVPWKRRAEMRQGWREKFDTVFLRPWVPPEVHTTLQQKDATGPLVISDVSPKKKRKRSDPEPSRRSGRIAVHDSGSGSGSDRHSSRLRRYSRPRYVDPDTDADEPSSDEEAAATASSQADERSSDERKDQPLPFQGQCQTVEIMIDNQNLREWQYGMEDFQDDPESSEDEWDGDKDDGEDTYAW